MVKHLYDGGLRGLFMLVSLMMSAVMLAACTSEASGEGSRSSHQVPVVSIMAPLHFPHAPSSEVIDKLENLTGVSLDITWVPDGIYTDKMYTALSTGSLKKVTFIKHTDYMMVKNSIRGEAFWEIGPYLERFPNLKHLDDRILNQAAVDGKIYGLYTERPSSRQGIIIREDWLDNLGLPKPSTLEELYETLRQFTTMDPDGNGRDDTVGLTDRNDLIYGAFKTLSSYFGTPNNWGIGESGIYPEFDTEAYRDTMDFMKRLYDEGLINADFAVASKEIQRYRIIRGTAGVYIGSMTDVQRIQDEAKELNPAARFTLINRIAGPDGFRVWSIPNYNGLYLFSKKAIRTEEELLQHLAFFDRTMDKDVANLLRFGIEDVHYKQQNGLVSLSEETTQLRVSEVNALYALMIADLSNPNVLKVEQQEYLLELAERLSADNEKFIVNDPALGLDSKTYDEKSPELYKIIRDATYKYILGQLSPEGFDAEVARWKRSGGDDMSREYTEAYFGQE
ncbi:extracellular solute-binding protein [Paenibacillus sp. CAU 1782]